MSLREYNRKRSFEKSPEPPGKPEKRKGALRFVIQLHRATRLHYDFRLEMGGSYKSWAVPRGPSLNPNDQRLAVFVEDHPIAYGAFEGIIPRGNYGAGTVMIWDQGTYEERGNLGAKSSAMGEKAMLEGLENGHMTFVLSGEKLHGEFALIKLKKGEQNAWLLVKKRDEFSSYKIPREGVERSAVSGRTMEEIAAESEGTGHVWIPNKTKRAPAVPKGAGSAPTFALDSAAKPEARQKPARKPAPKHVPKAAQKPSPRPTPVATHGTMPRRVRPMEPLLAKSLPDTGDWVFTSLNGGLRALAEVEGKRAHLYSKRLLSFDAKFPAVIEALEATELHALLDGEVSRDGKVFRVFDLLYVGGKEGEREDLRPLPLKKRLVRLKRLNLRHPGSPKSIELALGSKDSSELPASEAILARSADSPYRSGVDSDWLEVRGTGRVPGKGASVGTGAKGAPSAESPPVFSNLEKLFWKREKITKGDLIDYYRSVAPLLLPHLEDRPMSLHRFPNGSEEKGFYQKDFTGYKPRWVKTHRLYSETASKSIDYVVCQNENTLLYLANLGCIEMNPWLSRTHTIERPDYLVIDIDPDRQGFEEVVQVTHEVRKVLEKVGAESFCKTSGATGMHICVPLQARYEFEEARAFAEAVCKRVQLKLPALTSLERNPAKRGGRMYLDYMQNRIGQTLASAYSVRPRTGAPVSAPLRWSEVTRKLDPGSFTIHNMAKRLDRVGDLWKPVLERQVDVAACLRKLNAQAQKH